MYNYYNCYAKLRPKQQNIIREREYMNFLSNLLIKMIEFRGFPKSVNTKNLNLYRMFNGTYGVTEYKGDLISLKADPQGVVDFNGDFINVKMSSIFAPLNLDRVNNKNCVVGYNNSMRTGDEFIMRTAHMLAQTDLSMVYNLFYSRLNKIFTTDNEETTKAIKDIYNGMTYGQIGVVTSSNIVENISNGISKGIQELNLTDIKDIDKLQYLTTFHWDIMKRFLWAYGIPLNNQSKQAQVTTAEIENSENGSNILLFDMLDCANEFCERVNKLYGLNTCAELGDSWEMCLHSQGVCSDKDGVHFDELKENEGTENEENKNDD